mmetsp:Transcript_37447/g.45210  ORF Transcript_37447/g.45210 Transcript_37447/m.45210 type:complete len:165 (+) Transcript_37447:151-645(+)|eukprot:CAMPEP_0197843578 /NCGR_PEP_ID=MMETSP1438-20131217/452_1 /TAXON_ID=1461541 /ORGANISM="Pterosperma sp., Strain CCMP1384" /LENGTH=164 /DNA_ID=CAMNT_0043453793 /DNA_START=126 /DNA_END=620 /DNA_ORIENTATION=+
MASFLQNCGASLDPIAKGGWKHGPLGCYGDCENCGSVPCRTACVGGMAQFGMTAHALGDNCLACSCFYCCCPCIAGCLQRGTIRAKYNIDGNPLFDFLMACCCGGLVVLQNANEVGEEACFTNKKLSVLLTPPSKEEMTKMAEKAKADAAQAAKEAKEQAANKA